MQLKAKSLLRKRALIAGLSAAILVGGVVTAATATATTNGGRTGVTISSTGLKAGQIKHVWLIILENKSYDATFTGLNQNSYLWKTLPSQGVLLKNYYGTGHSSMDNYLSMVSGQAPEEDTQSDCSVENYDFGSNASIVTTRARTTGQVASPANAAPAERRERAERRQRLHLPDRRPDAVQPARRGRQDLEGLRAGPRQPARPRGRRRAAARDRRRTTRRPTRPS